MFNFGSNRVDHLGLRSALADRLLPVLVGAMSFLAALAIAGTLAAATLAAHWQGDTRTALTIQVPNATAPAGGTTRLAAVLAALQATPGVRHPLVLGAAEVNRLLAPWLGPDVAALALPIPAVITASWESSATPDALAAALARIAPGTLVATGAAWAGRVGTLTASLQACAAAVLVIVALIATGMVSLATRSGLAQRRETIEIIHGLGALDSDIAGRFAGRAATLAVGGAVIGTLLALPVLFWLATLAAPFSNPGLPQGPVMPPALWMALPMLPVVAALIGWGTAQLTVRGWLRHLA
jgi:cell division transport system permease protein